MTLRTSSQNRRLYPSQYIPCRVCVSAKRQTAERTFMNPDSKGLLDSFATARTCLGSSTGIDFNYFTSSIFSFGLKDQKEIAPCCIRDTFRKMLIFNHVFDAEILNRDKIKLLDKSLRSFVMKVASLVSDMFSHFRSEFNGLASSCASLVVSSGNFLLSSLELLLSFNKKLRRSNLLAGRCGKEGFNPDINANSLAC